MKNEQTKPVKVVRNTKTHHQTGYHKPVKNPTTNYPKDSHKEFCKRCLAHNGVFGPQWGVSPHQRQAFQGV